MEKRFEYNIQVFKKINVEKKYIKFTFYDIDSFNELWKYAEKDMIVRLKGIPNKYYQYTGDETYTSSEPKQGFIRVKDGRKIVAEIKTDYTNI